MDGLEPVGTTRTKANTWESKDALPLIYSWKPKKHREKDKAAAIDYNTERAKLAKEQRIGQEIKNAKEMGDLIPKDQITDAWGRIVSAAKRQFLALPDRLAQMLETTGTVDERRALIESEIKVILEGLAKGAE